MILDMLSARNRIFLWSRLLIHPRGVEGAHDFLGNSENTNSIRQAQGEPGQALVPTLTLETNKSIKEHIF